MADRDAHLTDPDVPRRSRSSGCLDPAHAADARRAGSTRDRAARPPAATNPRGGGTIYLATVDADGNAVSLIESNYIGLRVGRRRPGDRDPLPEPGLATSASIPTIPNVLAPGKRTLHTLLPGMLFRDGERRPWVVAGLDGRRRPAADPRPARLGAGRRRGRRRGPRSPRRAGSSSRRAHFAPPVDVRARAALRAGRRRRRSRRSATRCPDRAVRRRSSATSTRSSSSTADRPRPTARSPRRRTRAAPGCRPSGEPSVDGCRRPRLCDTPRRRWRAALTRRRHRSRRPIAAAERRVTSNVGQNYPYTSETEADRAAAIAAPRRGARGPGRQARGRDDAARRERALVGLEVPDAGLPGPPPRRRATRPRSTPSTSSATGPAARPSCADARPCPAGDRPAAARRRRRSSLRRRGSGSSASRRPGFGFVFGLAAREAGFSPIEAMAMSLIVVRRRRPVRGGRLRRERPRRGPAIIAPDGPAQRAPPALLGGARAVAARRRRSPSGRSMAHLLTDEAFALSIAHFRRIGRTDDRGYWLARDRARRSSRGTSRRWPACCSAARSRTRRGSASTSSSRRRWSAWRSGSITGRRELVAAIAGAAIGVVVALAVEPADRDRRGRRPRAGCRAAGAGRRQPGDRAARNGSIGRALRDARRSWRRRDVSPTERSSRPQPTRHRPSRRR